MATTPQFLGPDDVLREELVFTTTIASRFFTGTIAADTVDLQVSIRGSAFSSDPDFIIFEGTSFTIPNPASFPEGLDLAAGVNTIQLRAVDTAGTVSAPGEARVTLVQEGDLGLLVSPPTGISLEKRDSSVRITVEGFDTETFRGIHFYGSPYPGGSTEGYVPLNVNLVTDYESEEEETELASLPVTADIATGPGGGHAADPLFFSVIGTQEDEDETVLQTDFHERLEISEDIEKISVTVTVNRVRDMHLYSFDHDRAGTPTSTPPTIYTGAFGALSTTDPVYYVATAVFYNSENGVEMESPFSPELSGYPLTISTALSSLALVSRDQIEEEMSLSIYRSHGEISIQPGSVLRDTVVDPISTDLQRIRLIEDFIHRAQSFDDLLRIDDPALSGESVPVSQSGYKLSLKQALHLAQDSDVQLLIDQAFEKQASKVGVYRSLGDRARGEASFYTTKRPTASIPIPIGSTVSGGGATFRTTQAAEITLENIASFFSPVTGRYSVRVAIQASEPGSAGNLGPKQIKTIGRGPTGLSVANEARTAGGNDRQSNRDLAIEAQNRWSSVDSGTLQGYVQTAVKVPGVVEVKVAGTGDSLMQRDFDETTKTHRGGKVDIWVRGTMVNPITDAFAFRFEIAQNVLFELVDDPLLLRFQAQNANLSASNPIIEMLDIPSFGFGLRNDSTGEDFDLTDVVVESYGTIQLSTSVPQPSVSLTDVVRGDFRYRSSDKFYFTRQPLRRINQLTGSVSGEIDPSLYGLYRLASPLREGRSTQANDYLQLAQETAGSIPSGQPIVVTNENHVIIGEVPEYVDNLGANPLTVAVYNSTRTILYRGPWDPSGSNDYTLLDGDEQNPLGIVRTTTGVLVSGQELSVDYEHDENFEVSYDSNFIVTAVQDGVDAMRHITADVLAKESTISNVNLSGTIVLRRGSVPGTVDGDVRTNLMNYMRGLGNGSPLRPSDVVGIIENTNGVSYVVLPLTKMVRDTDSLIIREALVSDQASDVVFITAWSTSLVSVYLLEDALANATTDGGGSATDFRGIFEDDVELQFQIVLPSTLGESVGRGFIIGKDGYPIPDYSDDATLRAQGYTTDAEIQAAREALTANRTLVSVLVDDTPVNYDYAVTYLVGEDSGVRSLETGEAESLALGDLVFTYDEDRV